MPLFKIHTIQEKSKLSIQTIAAQAGLPPGQMKAWVNGEMMPGREANDKINALFQKVISADRRRDGELFEAVKKSPFTFTDLAAIFSQPAEYLLEMAEGRLQDEALRTRILHRCQNKSKLTPEELNLITERILENKNAQVNSSLRRRRIEMGLSYRQLQLLSDISMNEAMEMEIMEAENGNRPVRLEKALDRAQEILDGGYQFWADPQLSEMLFAKDAQLKDIAKAAGISEIDAKRALYSVPGYEESKKRLFDAVRHWNSRKGHAQKRPHDDYIPQSRLRTCRKEAGLILQEAAALTGRRHEKIRRLECSEITDETLQAILFALYEKIKQENPNSPYAVSQRIKKLKRKYHVTSAQLAEIMELAPAKVIWAESGTHRINEFILQRLNSLEEDLKTGRISLDKYRKNAKTHTLKQYADDEELIQARKKAGMTMQEAADRIGLYDSKIKYYETHAGASLETREKLLDLYRRYALDPSVKEDWKVKNARLHSLLEPADISKKLNIPVDAVYEIEHGRAYMLDNGNEASREYRDQIIELYNQHPRKKSPALTRPMNEKMRNARLQSGLSNQAIEDLTGMPFRRIEGIEEGRIPYSLEERRTCMKLYACAASASPDMELKKAGKCSKLSRQSAANLLKTTVKTIRQLEEGLIQNQVLRSDLLHLYNRYPLSGQIQ